jgi:hypothetical protein
MRRALLSLFALFALNAAPVYACSCVRPVPGPASLPRVTERMTAVPDEVAFEGTVVKAELHGALIDAKDGDLIPADLDATPPFMLVSFNVSRSYPTDARKTAEVRTGLGGGDCGFSFEVGKKYLVDAGKDDDGQLTTNICSQTAAQDASQAGDNGSEETAICGHIIQSDPNTPTEGRVFAYNGGNESPVPADHAVVEADRSFCVEHVDPGEYNLLFVGGAAGAPTSFAYFPDATKRTEAEKITVSSGQRVESLSIKVSSQTSYSVKGEISSFDKANLELKPKVLLLDAEEFSLAALYAADVATDGSFEFPKVLSGKYWAIVGVDDSDSKWLTRKTALDVDGDVAGLSVTLVKK